MPQLNQMSFKLDVSQTLSTENASEVRSASTRSNVRVAECCALALKKRVIRESLEIQLTTSTSPMYNATVMIYFYDLTL